MKRVAFVNSSGEQSWLGGLSYFRNLFAALHSAPSEVAPVIITASSSANGLLSFAVEETLTTRLADPTGKWWKLRRAAQLYLDRDFLFERFLRAHRIDLLSHSGYLGRRSLVPALPWIPDFQELYFPEFFTAHELAARRRNLSQCCRHATAILLSSRAAYADLAQAAPGCAHRAHVLPFVASVPEVESLPPLQELQQRYGFAGLYFHLPNQFWAHKNHELVIDALQILLKENRPVIVLATGNVEDHRQPMHYQRLKARIAAAGVSHLFRVLGVVPYRDLMALMAHSIAVINPSRFEGWSTTVEEAKSLGKQVIVSGIPVHREQAPERGAYFDPDDSAGLAGLLTQAVADYDQDVDRAAVAAAARDMPRRRVEFAARYEAIVSKLTSR